MRWREKERKDGINAMIEVQQASNGTVLEWCPGSVLQRMLIIGF